MTGDRLRHLSLPLVFGRLRLRERLRPWPAAGWRLGVGQKLVLLSLLLIMTVSFGFAGLSFSLSHRWIEEDLNASVITFARAIAATIGDRRELESTDVLHEEIQQILAVEPNLLQLDVLAFHDSRTEAVATSDPAGRLLFSNDEAEPARSGRIVSRLVEASAGRYWQVMAPVALEGAIPGAVAAKFSLLPADRRARRMRTWAFVFTAASVLVTGFLMRETVRIVVHRPIGRFMTAIGQVRAGDATATVSLESTDEFGALARHFNEMMARLNQFNEELQRRVSEATAELAQRYQQVQQLNELLFDTQRRLGHAERLALSGRIMAEVAHEVGTPLHSVAGHLELLHKDLPAGTLPPEAYRRLTIIEAQVARVVAIIGQLLDLTHRSPGPRALVDLNRLVRDTAELVGPGISAAGLRLNVALDRALTRVEGYGTQLQQVVLNLLTNAIDATPPGGQVFVTTRAVPDRREVSIEVRDTGRGIAATDRARIFEPFFSTKRPGHGTGLGLFISAQIAREHGGRIEVESTEGRGSTFRVILTSAPTRTA